MPTAVQTVDQTPGYSLPRVQFPHLLKQQHYLSGNHNAAQRERGLAHGVVL